MPLVRYDDGTWHWKSPPSNTTNAEYAKVVPEYLTAYDRLFSAAKKRSEFEFICALVHIDKDSHRDPFETTKTTFREIHKLHDKADDYVAEVSLALWLYGHVVEASYPYQLVGDIASIAAGHHHRLVVFPRDDEGHEISPGRKISQIEETLQPFGLKACVKPMRASWNAALRNAIFHSNYVILGSNIYLPEARITISVEDAMKRVNRTMAAFEAFVNVLDVHRSLYTDAVEIDAPIAWSHEPGGKVTVVVREGYGPVAIHDTVEDFGVKSPVILGRLYAEEIELVKSGIFKLPEHQSKAAPAQPPSQREAMNMPECATPMDDRIDAELFALNQRATKAIPEFFDGLQIEREGPLPVRFEEMWVAYLAAEIYGNADAALIAITHNRGRQARILERQMYEALKKAEYYIANSVEARLEFLAVPYRDRAYLDQLQTDHNSLRYLAAVRSIQTIEERFQDVAEYAETHRRERNFREMVGPQDAATDHEYAFHYRRLSQTPHGSSLGMEDVIDYRADGNIGIKFDGRLEDPNFAVQNMTIYLIRFLELLNNVFHLGRDADVEQMMEESGTIMARLRPEEWQEMLTEESAQTDEGTTTS